MPKFTKDVKDALKWSEAKQEVTEQYGLTPDDGESFWDSVKGIYKEMRGKYIGLKYDSFK